MVGSNFEKEKFEMQKSSKLENQKIKTMPGSAARRGRAPKRCQNMAFGYIPPLFCAPPFFSGFFAFLQKTREFFDDFVFFAKTS